MHYGCISLGSVCGAGEGWCPYSDITLAARKVRRASDGRVQKVMIIDTDVHQGNGHERDKLHFQDADMFIVDIYNAGARGHLPPSHKIIVVI